jgi:hypothetical protein
LRTLKLLLVLIALSSVSRATSKKVFPATHDSVAAENRRADALGMRRYIDMRDVNTGIAGGELVPIEGVRINAKLPKDRHYLRPKAEAFLQRLNRDCGSTLTVDSAVRPATVQRRLERFNPNAAPFDGYRASSHERGSTFDISRKTMRTRQYRFLLVRLQYYRATGKILVIEERVCLHVFVGDAGDYLNDVLISSPVVSLEPSTIPMDVLTDSSVAPE